MVNHRIGFLTYRAYFAFAFKQQLRKQTKNPMIWQMALERSPLGENDRLR